MDVQEQEQTTIDAFDAAISAESNYREPVSTDATIEPAPRADDGTFTKADEAKQPVETKPDEKPAKPRNDPDARIAQAIGRQKAAERRAEDAERKARELEARAPAAKTEAAKPIAAATPETFPDYATYLQAHPDASLEVWLDARDDWRDTKRDAKAREQQETSRLEQTFESKASSFGEKYEQAVADDPELPTRLNQELLTVRPYSLLTAQDKAAIRAIPDQPTRDRVAFMCFLADHWIESEQPLALLEHLSDPKEFQRLATLPPNQVIRVLAKVEAGLSAAPPRGPAEKPPVSHARPPIKPLGTTGTTAPADDGSDDEPLDAFIRRENAKDRKAGRF